MELWIRSQSKLSLIKVKDISLEIKKDNVIFITSGEWRLGTYISKKRALEVLDEIQNILKPQLLIRRNDNNDKVLLGALQKGVTQKIDMEYKELSTYVYEMPKE